MTHSGRRLRVLVVDDSAVQRQVLSRLLGHDAHLEIVGWSANGAEAVRAAARLRPDVITLDDKMPVMGGLEAARQIMAETPTPIVMISAATGAESRALTDAALAAGVLAVQDKKALNGADPDKLDELLRVIRTMATVRLVRRRRAPRAVTPSTAVRLAALKAATAPEIVAIGASTGGPQALREIISRLPASFPLPVLVVQHTTSGYSNTLVDWLRIGARLPVHVAEDGEPLDQGGIYVAPTERHLVVRGRHLALLDDGAVSLHRPSATVLFRSIVAAYGPRAIGILLTGMGNDGAAGLLDMKHAGALTIAQDEASSVVFGMPAEAIRLGAADQILPPSAIPSVLLDRLARRTNAA